jgi:cytochrome c
MTTTNTSLKALASAALFAALAAPAVSQAADATAAQALARKENCLKCHSVDKAKEGPAFKTIAAKYKGKADAEATVTKQLTSGPKVKFADGHEEEHKVIKASAGDTKNLVQWILAQ